MKTGITKKVMGFLLVALMFFGHVAIADEPRAERFIDFSKEQPSATLEFSVKAVKLLAGASWGEGVLHYQGRAYPVKVNSISLGGIGFQKIEGVGEVYFLNSLRDFAGKYRGGVVGATIVSGEGIATVENTKNVIIRIKGKSKGLALSASFGGVDIEFIN